MTAEKSAFAEKADIFLFSKGSRPALDIAWSFPGCKVARQWRSSFSSKQRS